MKPDFNRIKASTDIVRVIESYGVALKKQGKDHIGLCPFHEDHEPSLRVTAAKGLFRCMACGATGNVIQFVARQEGISEKEAAHKLLGSIPGVQRGSELSSSQSSINPVMAATLLKRVAAFYAKTLHKDRAGIDYLKSRRLDDPTMLEHFQIGYCNGTLHQALPKSGEVIEGLKALGILNAKGREHFNGRVVVPIFESGPDGRLGEICGMYGRQVEPSQMGAASRCHLYLAGEQRGVFNGITAKTNQTLLITEAIFDAMSLWQAGFKNVISLYGNGGWTTHHETLIKENGIIEVYLALDNDERSRAATERLGKKISSLVKSVHVIEWPTESEPDGRIIKDANDFFISHNAADFEALLKAANPGTEQQSEITIQQGNEQIEMRPDGFAAVYGNSQTGSVRRYELCAIEKPNAGRLKATVKALGAEPGRFTIDTVDFYLSRSRRAFICEAARLFRDLPEMIESDINRLIVQLENYVDQKLESKSSQISLVPELDKLEAVRLGRNNDLVGEILRDLEKLGLVGESTNKLMAYLAMTSRRMEDPLALQILSGSGAGKSHLQDGILSLCPEEDLIKLTSLTDRALFYKGEDSLKHKVLAVEEEAGASGARYAIRNLISAKKLTIESTIKNPISGRLETQVNTVNGPTAVFETTTNPDTDPETKSRFIIISVDESPEQTRAILAAQRHGHTLDGMRSKRQREVILKKHHALQRLLKPLTVVNPFEPYLTYADDRLLVRRDHPKYLNLILAITFLHQMQRPLKHDPELGDYIETTLDDIAIANDLAHELFGQSLDDLSLPSRELLRLSVDYVQSQASALNIESGKIEFSRRQLREVIKWNDTRLRTHLSELVRLEYVQPLSGGMGKSYCYRLLVDAEETHLQGRFLAGLKSVEQLRTEANLAGVLGNLAGQNGHLAPTPQVAKREVETASVQRANGHTEPDLAGFGGRHIYALRNHGSRIVIANGSEVER